MGALYLTVLHLIELDSLFWWQTICRLHYLAFGDAGLEDRNSNPGRVWKRIPDDVRDQIVDLSLDTTDLSPRELAVRFTDTKGYFVSEA